MGKLVILASAALLLGGIAGCRDPKIAHDTGQKIDLTLPKPQSRSPVPQKTSAEPEVLVDKKETKKLEAVATSQKRAPTDAAKSRPRSTVPKGGKLTKQKSKIIAKPRDYGTTKPRDPVKISEQRDSNESIRKNAVSEQRSPPREVTKRYQQSANPLHPSYRK